jgi:sulfur carrier protein ThiS
MEVTVVLLGMHRALLPPGALQAGRVALEFDGDTTDVAHVVAARGMRPGAARIVFLDGNPVTDDHVLRDGQTVTFVSPVGGG